MNAKLVSSATGVINAALTQNRTAAGIALALESAGLLMSPEVARELASLRARFAVSDHPADEDPIAFALTDKEEGACSCGPQMRCPNGHCSRHYMCPDCGNCCSCTCGGDDVRPQVRKLRALLAGQRPETGGVA